MVTLTIDNQPITVPTGTTILDAARQADIRILFRREGLPRQGRFLGLQGGGLQQPGISRDQVPCFQHNHIPRHQRCRRNRPLTALPDHPGHGRRDPPEAV